MYKIVVENLDNGNTKTYTFNSGDAMIDFLDDFSYGENEEVVIVTGNVGMMLEDYYAMIF